MSMRTLTMLALAATLVTLGASRVDLAATRARARGDLVLNDPPARFSAGQGHACQVRDDATVRCWGQNTVGQLGDGTQTTQPTPVQVSGLTGALAVSAGGSHTCALLFDGSVRCWGFNQFGQLGDATTTQRITPVAVSGLTNAVSIAAANSHTCALLSNGTVRCWGANNQGQLGDGTTTDSSVPVVPVGVSGAVGIAVGSNHTCAMLSNGTATCWGANATGQLGDGTTTSRLTAAPVFGLANVVAMDAGDLHTCALLADGTARCWGFNDQGRLGDGTTSARLVPTPVLGLTNAVSITIGGLHTCALRASGGASCWGGNGSGQVGVTTTGNLLSPVTVSGLSLAVSVDAGAEFTCAVLADGSARCWGANFFGQLGRGTTGAGTSQGSAVLGGGGSFAARDVATGRAHSCIVRGNGTVSCWGLNQHGQLGDGSTNTVRLTAVNVNPLSPLTGAVAVAAGDSHTCALLANGTARCWGTNDSAQLGSAGGPGDSPTPVTVLNLSNAVSLTAGTFHTCALLANGTVSCWGTNFDGQVGQSQTGFFSFGSPVPVAGVSNAVAIAAGSSHTCALLANGSARCWGSNLNGELGRRDCRIFGCPANSTPDGVASLSGAVAITAGLNSTCALRADGTGACWGHGESGELGDGTLVTSRTLIGAPFALSGTVAVGAGRVHTCGLAAGGGAFCWGDNSHGQLGDGTTTSRSLPTAVTTRPTFLVVPLGRTTQIATGDFHTCALQAHGGVLCWGDNDFGQLGDGTTVDKLRPGSSVPSITLNIDPQVHVEREHGETTVTVLAICDEDRWLHADVVLTQGEVTGHGIAEGPCTGGLARYPVKITGRTSDPGFLAGAAVVEAEAIIRGPEGYAEPQTWTRRVEIMVEAQPLDADAMEP